MGSQPEKRTNLRYNIGRLIELKQRRTCPAPGSAQSDEDPHVSAALVRVRVSPIGVADIIDAVCAAAVGRVRNPNAFGFVRGREGEGTRRRDEGLIWEAVYRARVYVPCSIQPPGNELLFVPRPRWQRASGANNIRQHEGLRYLF